MRLGSQRREGNRRFQLQKRRQLFIRTHNGTLSVATQSILGLGY